MKIYNLKSGILIESDGRFYFDRADWDDFINSDNLFAVARAFVATSTPVENGPKLIATELLPPVKSQEIWASGVTYFNSKLARQEESQDAGGGDFYARVYVADRPELFFKSAGFRAVGSGGKVRIRRDSTWDVPEPELTLVINSKGSIIGYTVGNDMSSRSIEGENPLYLPQAKSYDGSASVGPCVLVAETPIDKGTAVEMSIIRDGAVAFEGRTDLGQIKRGFGELVSWLFREMSFPNGCLLMTGTGIIPSNEFTLQSGDEICITIAPIGTLVNTVE